MSRQPPKPPERIWLIPDGEGGFMWCDDPAPGTDMDPADAIEYTSAESVKVLEAKVKAYEAALNPNETKYAYIGEVKNCGGETVSWTATKDVMSLIRRFAQNRMKNEQG